MFDPRMTMGLEHLEIYLYPYNMAHNRSSYFHRIAKEIYRNTVSSDKKRKFIQ